MNTEVISEKTANILNELLSEKNFDAQTNTCTLNEVMDSLEYVRMIVELEKCFDIKIPDEYLILGKLNSISDIVELISRIENAGAAV